MTATTSRLARARWVAAVATLAVLVGSIPSGSHASVPADDTAILVGRPVTTWAVPDSDLVGIAYDPARAEFLVATGSGGDVAVTRMGRSWQEVGPASVDDLVESVDPGLDSRLTIDQKAGTVRASGDPAAYHPTDGLSYVLRPGSGRLDALDATGETVATYDVSSVPMESPEAITFAPSSDATDDPDALNLFVADPGSGEVMEVTLEQPATLAATSVTAGLIRAIDTSDWNPPSTDPSGIVWSQFRSRLIVVDSEVEETSHYQQVNLWEVRRAQGTVARTGTTLGYSDEPTGLGYDNGTDTLFISDDTGGVGLYVVRPGSDGNFGTADDSVTSIARSFVGTSDAEDPEFHPASGDLFVLGGVDREIYRIDPVDGVFGNGNDTVTGIDISHLGPTDFEGLSSLPVQNTLLVGARWSPQIFEITLKGGLIRVIDASSSGAGSIDGLARAPSSVDPSESSLWIVERGADEVNDGMIYEITAPALDGNAAPVVDAGRDRTVVMGKALSLAAAVSDDGYPQSLTLGWAKKSGPGTVTFQNPAASSTTATFGQTGVYVLELSASDGDLTAKDSLIVTVEDPPAIAPIDDVMLSEGETGVIPVVVAGPSGDDLEVTVQGLPPFGSLSPAGDEITLAPQAGDGGQYGPITVSVTGDPSGFSAQTSFGLTVNRRPVAKDDHVVTGEGLTVSAVVLANDSDGDGDALSVTGLTQPGHGAAVANASHTVTYTPDPGFSGTDTFTYRAFDGLVASGAATVTVTVEEEAGEPQEPQPSDPHPQDPDEPVAPVPADWFVDDDEHLFELDINAAATAGITRGCNPPTNDRFCPDDLVTRGQMAAFLVRALGLEAGSAQFTDTGGSVFASDISALATAGITRGCNPPTNDRFCPDDPVTRGQMAAFLARALIYGR